MTNQMSVYIWHTLLSGVASAVLLLPSPASATAPAFEIGVKLVRNDDAQVGWLGISERIDPGSDDSSPLDLQADLNAPGVRRLASRPKKERSAGPRIIPDEVWKHMES